MNAIEMAISAALTKMMDRAPDLIANIAGNLPPDIVSTIGQIGKTVADFRDQLDRIEDQNRLIIDLLKNNVPADITETERNA